MTREDKTAGPASASAAQLLTRRLLEALSDAGYRARLAPIRMVNQARERILELREQGLVREELALTYGVDREFSPPPDVPEPRTLIVVASPSFPVCVRFELDSGPFEAAVPPTYISTARGEQALGVVRGVLEPVGFAVAQVRVPDKLLAVRSGLAQYGRNNVSYVQGMGSFARLDVFCTDADLGAREYQTKASELMSCCPPCRNCHHHCPTGCIPHDGTVIDATRCLTYVNEQEGEWPGWLDPHAHNSLVGCMRCQEMCPANRYYLRKQHVVAEFDAEETAVILENRPPEQLPEPVLAKLQALDLDGYSPVLGRNLLALVKARE